MCAKSLQSYPILCDPMDRRPPGSSVHGILQAKNTGVGSHFLLPGIFPIQGSNLGFPHCRQILYHLSHQRSPEIMIVSIYKNFFVANKLKKKKGLEEKTFGEKNGGSKKINES